ncbi:DNA helicase rad5 [Microbotryomycetes sp. JL221]|nr:DNA helicase rad5 [Microbotryomycetes sp. JL221]
MPALFRTESGEDAAEVANEDDDRSESAREPSRDFFQDDDDQDQEEDVKAVGMNRLDHNGTRPQHTDVKSSSNGAAQSASTSRAARQEYTPMILSDSDDDNDVVNNGSRAQASSSKRAQPASTWTMRHLGNIIVQGYALYSYGTFCKLQVGEAVSIDRVAPKVATTGKKPKTDDHIVRFSNSKQTEVGRISEVDASWMCKLLDLSMISFTGNCVDCPRNFRSADTITLSLSIFVHRSAFIDPNIKLVHADRTSNGNFFDSQKESDEEKQLRLRKLALNKMFDKMSLSPVMQADATMNKALSSFGPQSKRRMLEKMEKQQEKQSTVKKEADSDDEADISDIQLNMVYKKATKNDASLPEMDPPDTFALTLRPYQKQALKWMYSMEVGDGKAREQTSIHPLWEEYNFSGGGKQTESSKESFFYNPYSGELSLVFPKASVQCRGGILADEMGLGKTIMIASLLHTALPIEKSNASDGDADEIQSDSADESKGRSKAFQAKLKGAGGKLAHAASERRAKSGRPHATLVVAPMTLLSQWCEELQRASKEGLNVLMYYGNNRTDLQDEIDSGIDVVVTSYGVLISDWKSSGYDVPKPSIAKKPKVESSKGLTRKIKPVGLFNVDWFRIVLDEAHTIKKRDTQGSKAASALVAERRWCLTGTPIVNRLEDLYSLLHFLRLEPWGNYSFFRTFVTLPFEKKDPRAIEVIQVVLESILLRREKKMKDKDGRPIVNLPAKHIDIKFLKFSEEERRIYTAIYRNAKSQFLGYAEKGTVLSNVTAIFAVLMRLRQVVLHPALVMENIDKSANEVDRDYIKKLIGQYNGPETRAMMQELSIDDANDGEADQRCVVCLDPPEAIVFLPGCLHAGCKGCFLTHFEQLEEAGARPRCPACNSGPLSDKHLLEIQNGSYSTKEQASRAKSPLKKKATYTITSSSNAGSSPQTVLTILDSSDEDEQPAQSKQAPATPPNRSNKDKGKGKRPASTTDDDDQSDGDSIYMSPPPSVRKNGTSSKLQGDLFNSDSDEEPAVKKPVKQVNNDKGGLVLLKNEFRSSTKLDALVEHLTAAKEKDPNLKAVVFSQFTTFLSLIERIMNREGFNYCRLDGAMTQKKRQSVVHQFTKSKESVILLASLKAGGVGLNLIAADHVYLMDAWWNAAIENQAIDRIHRFGQTREVHVTRFLIDSTIENRIVALQERKTRMINGALGKGNDKSDKQLAEDLALIFAD